MKWVFDLCIPSPALQEVTRIVAESLFFRMKNLRATEAWSLHAAIVHIADPVVEAHTNLLTEG